METRTEPLPPATDEQIRMAIGDAYNEAETNEEPPPNVKRVRPLALARLVRQGRSASLNRIGKIADELAFKSRRRPPGKTLKSEGPNAAG